MTASAASGKKKQLDNSSKEDDEEQEEGPNAARHLQEFDMEISTGQLVIPNFEN